MQLNIKPSHAKVKDYYSALNQFGQLNISHETAVRQAFASLLDTCAKQFKWKLVQEFRLPVPKNKSVIVDGAVLDSFTLKHGFWEAKDLKDHLEKEIKKKLEQGYPRNNIIFQSPERAILYQGGLRVGLNEDITKAENLVNLLSTFFAYREPHQEEWETAVAEFSSRIPEIAAAVEVIIKKERLTNKDFASSFEAFVDLCRQAINPNLSEGSVETMLIQHLLTERIFRRVFNNPEFTRRNIIAAEIEKVINTLTSKHFSRDAFLQDLDRFYRAIAVNADNATDYSEKQTFLNTVYERFFQGFSPREADTHGIVYTPQPIVNFMVRSVEEILQGEFGKSLSRRDVHVLDPFVGTGNFIVRIMQEIQKTRLEYKFENELHCNENMLLPYYIASMNIEHAYLDATGTYKPFEGICLVDTFELAEQGQSKLFTAENTARVEKQKRTPIFVIIGNPPYYGSQENENDNNKTRRYKNLDGQVSDTYARDSSARLLNKLNDPYVKAIRWASNRTKGPKVISFVTNSSFLDRNAFDGMRKNLESDFDAIYIVDLGGDIRKNPKLSGTTHNVFGIQVGVAISFLIRKRNEGEPGKAKIYYCAANPIGKKEEKFDFLNSAETAGHMKWTRIEPDDRYTWLREGLSDRFAEFLPIAGETPSIFDTHSLGVSTNRDSLAYNFNEKTLETNVKGFVEYFNSESIRFQRAGRPKALDDFLRYDRIKWSRNLKRSLRVGSPLEFDRDRIVETTYRPFTNKFLYFARLVVDEVGKQPSIFPIGQTENVAICAPVIGGRSHPWAFCVKTVPNLNLTSIDATQSFPFYFYGEEGKRRHDNVTDWALTQFRSRYKDRSITKWDIFYYAYAVLHHEKYRTQYAANLKRELPRIPLAPDFRAFAKAGKRLAEVHVDYEKQKEYPVERKEKAGEKLDLRVEKIRLSKDKATLIYNDFLTLDGIPKETYEYRLGNRSALEWVIDQYQVSTDKRSGITNDPNRDDDPEYILRLIGQVITVSLETVKIIKGLPDLGLPKE
ncbi:MAG TPA: type ISP restriction/modification enzyme [Candidatus Acidoferrales bacterium]